LLSLEQNHIRRLAKAKMPCLWVFNYTLNIVRLKIAKTLHASTPVLECSARHKLPIFRSTLVLTSDLPYCKYWIVTLHPL
jgi:hypothetical protein